MWKKRPITEIAELAQKRPQGNEPICVDLEHVSPSTGQLLGGLAVSGDEVSKLRFNRDDVLFAKLRPYLKKAWLSDREGICSSEFWVFKAKKDFGDPAFIQQFVLSESFLQACAASSGSKMPRADWSYVETIKFPLPPLVEQRKIAEILRTWDEAIETAEAELKAKQERKRGVTLKLLNPSGEGAGAVMANWTKVHLGSLVDANVRWSFSGGPFGSNLKASDYTEDGVRIIQLQNIGEGVFNDEYKIFTSESKADDLIANNIYPGEIIFSKMGDPVARACIVPCGAPRYVMASDGIRFKPDPKKADVYFLLNYVNCAAFRKAAESVSSGSTRMRIGLDELRMLEIPLPPLVEQRKIAEVLLSEDEGIDSLKAKANLLRAQKRGLMQKLLTGEVRVAA